jgi:DNA ligase-1
MTTIDKPMLAPNDEFDIDNCSFPKMGSAKIDGFRMLNQQGSAYTRSGKPMANEATQAFFSRPEFDGLDGELVVGEPNDPNVFNNSQGPLKRKDGDPKAVWYIFDDRTFPKDMFKDRTHRAANRIQQLWIAFPELQDRIQLVKHSWLNKEDLDEFEDIAIEDGYEGIMLRDPCGLYKYGRATYKENTLLKVKRLVHEEGVIVGFEEQMINENEAFKDELGRTKRQSLKENLIPSGMVGAFWIQSDKWPTKFKVSAGSLTHEDKKAAFENFESDYKGKIGAYKYFGHGSLEAPRQGVFKGIRSPSDMS